MAIKSGFDLELDIGQATHSHELRLSLGPEAVRAVLLKAHCAA